MKTLVAMLSVGDRDYLTDYSFNRLAKWAARNGYTSVLIKDNLADEGKLPHYGKLLIPKHFPNFDQYCIVDDDLLINSIAPALPDIPDDCVGLVADVVQSNTFNPLVNWTGNTGFILCSSRSCSLLEFAYRRGDDSTIWGIADQGALNSVLWQEKKNCPP